MKIALIGYGKMGKLIAELAVDKGHTIDCVIDKNNQHLYESSEFTSCDVAIEFSTSTAVVDNIAKCLKAHIPVVVGTTGWHNQYQQIEQLCIQHKGSIIHATNFSIGVNLFFALNKKLAILMKSHTYEASVKEIHHTQKLDSPSGTAITLAQDIILNNEKYTTWKLATENDGEQIIPIEALRENDVIGTHFVRYNSSIDEIEIKHSAHNRKGFANGAIIAAQWIINKKGIFTMQQLLEL